MAIASAEDVFFDQLTDLRSATEQVAGTLPDLMEWATDPELERSLASFRKIVESQVATIESIFRNHGKETGDDLCKAIAGLIDGGNKHIELATDPMIRDLLLIAHGNRLGHYLLAASEFTLGIARNSGQSEGEEGAIAGILEAHDEFVRHLGGISAHAFGMKLGL